MLIEWMGGSLVDGACGGLRAVFVPGAVRLVVPAEGSTGEWWDVLAAVFVSAAVVLLAASALGVWVWLGDRRRSTDPYDRAFRVAADRLGLGSAHRAVVVRLAGRLDGETPPVALLLSKAVLRRAVAAELETKPDVAAMREVTRLIEHLGADQPGLAEPDGPPPSPRR